MEGSKGKRTNNRNVALMDGDVALLIWCAEFLGTSQAEVMRSALRSFAVRLQEIAPQTRKL